MRAEPIPGLKRLPKPNGFVSWYWAASQITRNVGQFRPKTVRLWHGQGEPPPTELSRIASQAQQLTIDLKEAPGRYRLGARRSKRGTVYFVRAGERVKIGFTKDLDRRLVQLQNFFPDPLEVLLSMPGSILMEQELHRRFAADRLRGEWFLCSPAIRAFTEALNV